jgi:hypothetical protein
LLCGQEEHAGGAVVSCLPGMQTRKEKVDCVPALKYVTPGMQTYPRRTRSRLYDLAAWRSTVCIELGISYLLFVQLIHN